MTPTLRDPHKWPLATGASPVPTSWRRPPKLVPSNWRTTIKRSQARSAELSHLPQIGQGPFARRLGDFVTMRLSLHEANGSMFRATIYNTANHPRVRDGLHENRRLLREQFELQFGPELVAMSPLARSSATEAGNALTQIDSIDLL